MRTTAELQWQTTSKEYGRFYDYVKQEEEKKRFQRESDKRCEVLTKDVINCRAQLEVLRLRHPTPSPSPEAPEASEKHASSYLETYRREAKYPHSHARGSKLSSSNYSSPTKVVPIIEHAPSVQEDSNSEESNARIVSLSIEENAKPLQWILHRLVDKVQPLRRPLLSRIRWTRCKN